MQGQSALMQRVLAIKSFGLLDGYDTPNARDLRSLSDPAYDSAAAPETVASPEDPGTSF